jgi:hypothetical protein
MSRFRRNALCIGVRFLLASLLSLGTLAVHIPGAAMARVAQPNPATPQQARATILHQYGASTLRIITRAKGVSLAGTGFVVRADTSGTYMVTSRRLVAGRQPGAVTLFSSARNDMYIAQVVVLDSAKPGNAAGLAVIRMRPTSLASLPYKNPATLRRGDSVVSIGAPPSQSGIPVSDLSTVSDLHHDLLDGSKATWIQHATTLNTTALGGPMLTLGGAFAGMNLAVSAAGAQLYALPAALARPVIDNLVATLVAEHIPQTMGLPATYTPTLVPVRTSTATASVTPTPSYTVTPMQSTATPTTIATASQTVAPSSTPVFGTPYDGVNFTVSMPADWSAALEPNFGKPFIEFTPPGNGLVVDIGASLLAEPITQDQLAADLQQRAGLVAGQCGQSTTSSQSFTIGTLAGTRMTVTCSNGLGAQIGIAIDNTHYVYYEIDYNGNTPPNDLQQATAMVGTIVATP